MLDLLAEKWNLVSIQLVEKGSKKQAEQAGS
jgi:hypothetical protein